jgi:hypothetical protein
VSDHDHAGPGGAGFASGSALDTLIPGPALSAALDDTLGGGLDDLPDDALAGVILAARRCESRAAAQVLAAGGITCECDLGPACRKCHQAKQAPGWRLEQPRPGEFIWQPPHGRRYPATPDTYPI